MRAKNFDIQIDRTYIKECFLRNKVDGRRLILCNASRLNALGIADFKHIIVSMNTLKCMKTLDCNFVLFSQFQKVFENYYKLRNLIGIEVFHCLIWMQSVDILNNAVL